MTAELGSANYERLRNSAPLSKSQRTDLLQDYYDHYRHIAANDPTLLNQKLPRDVFKELLDRIGNILLDQASTLSNGSGPVKEFLDLNTLPPSVSQRIKPEFRAFCLALNAVKQWVSAEQQATDRFLLGGNARDELRALAGTCIVSGRSLEGDCELHHPVRDGRPPIPVCHEVHSSLEQQQRRINDTSDPILLKIANIRNRNNNSWRNLRRGCLEL